MPICLNRESPIHDLLKRTQVNDWTSQVEFRESSAKCIEIGLINNMPDGALQLTEAGWRILTWRWAFFFLCLAALNEYVWRHYSEETWVTFKSFGFMPLTIMFALAQTPVILRHETKDAPPEEVL